MLIAQVSDIHATAGGDVLGVLDRVMTWLRELSPDAVVVTGDVIGDAWVAGYETLNAHLATLDCPSFVLPGNSDLPAAMRLALASQAAWSAAPGPMHFIGSVGQVPLIGLDVTVSGAAHGDSLPHLDWLRAALQDARAPAILFMHQPPIPSGIDQMDVINCRHSAELLTVLEQARYQPFGLFCGHVHRPIFARLGALSVGICGSLCPANPLLLRHSEMPPITDGPSILVHEIRDRALRSHVVAFAA